MSKLPAALADQACLVAKRGTTITIECDEHKDAAELFDWLTDGVFRESDEDV